MPVNATRESKSPGVGPAMPAELPRLSLVLPAHNEEPIIRQAVDEAVSALRSLAIEFEVIVVDDGSTDGTRSAALAAAGAHSQVRVVGLETNVGYAGASGRGFAARHEWVAFTDADCQFDLSDLGRMLPLTQTADVVCGIRVDRQDPWRRKVYSRGFNILARGLLGTGVTDCDCALKIFRRDWVNSAGLEAQGFFFNAELLTRARQGGLTVAEVGVTHRPRQGGASKVSLRHVLPVLRTLLAFWWSQVLFSRPDAHDANQPPAGKLLAATVVLAVLAALSILPRLSYPLLDPDETRYAEIARVMLESGDLLVPMRQGKPYLDKPPLLYWLTAGCFRLFGTHEFSARLVTALAAIGTILGTFRIGRHLVGPRAAWIGALLQLMCIGFILSGRFLFMDSLLTFFTTISLLAGYAACRGGTFRVGYWILAAVACGLGTLTKGPVAPALCLPPLLTVGWLASAGSRPRLRHWIAYGAIMTGIALPWFVAVAMREPELIADFIWTHHVQRFTSGLAHREPAWFYVPILLIGMAPTSILLPAAITFLFRAEGARRHRTWDVGYLLLFSAWTLGLFTLSSCKLPPYILPVIPALCLVIGATLASILDGGHQHRFLAYVREHSPRDLCIVLTLAAPVVAIVDRLLLGQDAALRYGGYAELAVGGMLLIVALNQRWLPGVHLRWATTALFALFVLSYGVKDFTPAVAIQRCKVAPIRQLCGKEVAEATPIVCYSLNQEEDAFSFYFSRQQVRAFSWNQADHAAAALPTSSPGLLFSDLDNLERLLPKLPKTIRFVELGRYDHIVVGATNPLPAPIERAAATGGPARMVERPVHASGTAMSVTDRVHTPPLAAVYGVPIVNE